MSGRSAVLRRRIEMTKGSGYRARQPYHAAEEMKLPQAEAYLQRAEKIAVEMAAAAVIDAVASLSSEGFRVSGAAVLLGSGKPLPGLGRILAAHPLINTAEGVFFRDVLKSACEACGLAVAKIVGAAIGKADLVYKLVPAAQLKPVLMQMGMSSNMADLLLEMADALNSGHDSDHSRNFRSRNLFACVSRKSIPRVATAAGSSRSRIRDRPIK